MRWLWLLSLLWTWPLSALELRDAWQRLVVLEAPVQRVVALAPHWVENIQALDAQAQTVAVDANAAAGWPESVMRLRSYPELPYEQLLELQPEVILLWGPGVKPAQVVRLDRLGLVSYISQPQSLADIQQDILHLGQLLGSDQSAAWVQRVHTTWQGLAQYQTTPTDIMIQLALQPLLGLTDRDLLGQGLAHCGFNNILSHAELATLQISPEYVLIRQPQWILSPLPVAQVQSVWQPWLQSGWQPRWLSLVDDHLQRPSVYLPQAVSRLCQQLRQAV